jgi:hypothetical protein
MLQIKKGQARLPDFERELQRAESKLGSGKEIASLNELHGRVPETNS